MYHLNGLVPNWDKVETVEDLKLIMSQYSRVVDTVDEEARHLFYVIEKATGKKVRD